MITYQEAYDKYIVNNEERNWLISALVKEAYKRGMYTIVLVERLKHLEKLSKRLEDVPHKIVAGTFKGKGISMETRLKSQKKFEKGKIRVILANKVFKKGVDLKRLDFIINATGRKSKEDAIQIFGRGLRTHVDKDGLICIDINDVDTFDVDRKKKNWMAKAAKSRIRAFKRSGITMKKFIYEDEDDIKVLFYKAEKWLREEVKK